MDNLKPCPYRIIGSHEYNRATKQYDYEEEFAPCMGYRCPAFQVGRRCIRSNGGVMDMRGFGDESGDDNG